ncbi:MAG: mannose-1-phosphate guanylyltransferase/mannose-6-phosphate isomerase [Persephonella sp.]|nr:MAG: mannose-1-phosphate guanylyltransferase/mannose-6-phosphate isomerase [Persephonella sp.]
MKSIILAGGSGTRLFPLSRDLYPKQFLKLGEGEKYSFFQKTVLRNKKLVEDLNDIILLTNDKYKFLIRHHLIEILGKDKGENLKVILEPAKRNTAPSIALAVKYLLDIEDVSPETVLFISPSDHLISPEDKFVKYVKFGEELAKYGYIITFGVNPTSPETGYGYIEADNGNPIKEDKEFNAFKVKRFHEKPSKTLAQQYIAKGNYYWNSGMFMFSIKTILNEFEKHSPKIYQFIKEKNFEDFINSFSELPDISIDYAVMEKTQNAVVLPIYIQWSDIGSWDSVYSVYPKDDEGNVKFGNIVSIDTKNSLILGNKRLISTINIEDLIIVETDDVLLITHKGDTQKVKDLVKMLSEKEDLKEYVIHHTTVYRPWGSFTELEKGNRYKIKRLTVYPNESLSLQLHHHRSEHWVVVKGTAKVYLENVETGEKREVYVHENESIYVPKSWKHRLENPGKINLEVIEIQVGEYLEEDDIIRFQDKYRRS